VKTDNLVRGSALAGPSVYNAPSRAHGRLRRCAFATVAALALGAAAAPLAGCVATLGTDAAVVYGHPVVHADVVPAEIATYPRVYYRGHYAYLVDGAWYYPSGGGWVVFREEPVELRRYRTEYRRSPRYVPPPYEYGYPRERPRTYRPR
jgi:hypothetical protein